MPIRYPERLQRSAQAGQLAKYGICPGTALVPGRTGLAAVCGMHNGYGGPALPSLVRQPARAQAAPKRGASWHDRCRG